MEKFLPKSPEKQIYIDRTIKELIITLKQQSLNLNLVTICERNVISTLDRMLIFIINRMPPS